MKITIRENQETLRHIEFENGHEALELVKNLGQVAREDTLLKKRDHSLGLLALKLQQDLIEQLQEADHLYEPLTFEVSDESRGSQVARGLTSEGDYTDFASLVLFRAVQRTPDQNVNINKIYS